MDETQFRQLDASLDGLNGAINKLAESVAPVDSSVHKAIGDLSANLAKWQAAQTEAIKAGFALLAEALGSRNDDVILQQLQMLTETIAPIADLPLIKEELTLVHGKVSDLLAEKQAQIDALTADLKQSSTTVEDAITQDRKE